MTKNEIITQLKKEYPKLTRQVNNDIFDLTAEEYEETINRWAENKLIQIEEDKKSAEAAQAKSDLLTKLGISEDEAKLLLQ